MSCESALSWAYNISSRPIVQMAMVNSMRQVAHAGGGNDLLEGLTDQDRHGQAALIIGLIDRLDDPAAQEYVKAKFGRKIMREDLRFLVYRACDGLGLGLQKQEPVYRVIRSYFLSCLSTRTVRKEIGCRHYQAALVKSSLYEILDITHDRAMAGLREILEERGLVQPARYR